MPKRTDRHGAARVLSDKFRLIASIFEPELYLAKPGQRNDECISGSKVYYC